MDDDKRDRPDGDGGGERDDGDADVLMRVLEGRLRDAFAKFCADIPQILRSMPQRSRGVGGSTRASDDGADFVRALLEWIDGAPSRRERAGRYLLMWYAKSIADKGHHELPDGAAVVELIRARLARAELADVDLALRANWDALRYGASLKTVASRQRKAFTASLPADARRRFARYLALLPPLAIPAALPTAADAGQGAGRGAGPGTTVPASASGAGGLLGSLAIVACLPLAAGLGWYAVRGRGRAVPTSGAPPAERATPRGTTTSTATPHATPVSTETAQDVDADGRPVDRDHAEGGASTTGWRWTRQVSGVTSGLTSIAWSGSRAVIVGSAGTILTSDDGVAWQAAPQPRTHDYRDVAYGEGVFVAVGTNRAGTNGGQVIASSSDGIRWDAQTGADRPTLEWVAYGNGVFVACGHSALARSDDGEIWTAITAPVDRQLGPVMFLDDRFVLVDVRGAWLESADGSSWTAPPATAPPLEQRRLARADGHVVTIDARRARDRSSPWPTTDLSTAEYYGRYDHFVPTMTSSDLIAVGAGLESSSDGLEWTRELSAEAFKGYRSVWTGTLVIAVGQRGAIFTGRRATR